jgi:hypothetical protein
MRTQYAPTVRPNQVAIRNKFAAPTSKRRERKHVDLNWPVSVADGRDAVGVIDKIGGVLVAIDNRGVTLGEFSTLSEAVRILPKARRTIKHHRRRTSSNRDQRDGLRRRRHHRFRRRGTGASPQ